MPALRSEIVLGSTPRERDLASQGGLAARLPQPLVFSCYRQSDSLPKRNADTPHTRRVYFCLAMVDKIALTFVYRRKTNINRAALQAVLGGNVTSLLKVEGLRKSFGGVLALRDARFELESGTVHALCGGNGAGKSTFLSILMGIYRRDAGRIWRNGQEVDFGNPAEALASGIAIFEQELSPVPQMTVAENIFLGREPRSRFGGVDFRKMNAAAQAILDDLGFAIPASRYMFSLSVAQAQLVEIAKALSHDAEVIFMDEPTSAIGEREAHQLFSVVRRLREQGRGIVYVSHRLAEIFDIADHYTVLRDGSFVGAGPLASVDRASLIRMIVGHEISEEYAKINTPTEEEGLKVVGLTSPGKIADVSFTVRKGEIFGIYGLMGSGRSEIFDCLFGLDRATKGEVKLFGQPVS